MPRLRRMSLSSIQSLEHRICPSVTVSQLDLDSDGNQDDLRIVGGNEHTRIKITDEGLGQGSMLLDLDINGDGDFADVGDLQGSLSEVVDGTSVVQLQLGGGDDQVIYSLSEDLMSSRRQLSVDLGNGNDRFDLQAIHRFIASNSQFDLDLLAGSGNDEARILIPSVLQSSVSIDTNMGSGNDDVRMSTTYGPAWIDLQSTLETNIVLGAGRNTALGILDLDIGLITRADVSFDFTGGTGIDEIDFVTESRVGNGNVSSTFDVNAELNGGNDRFNYFMNDLDLRTNSVQSVRAVGGAGNDVLNAQMGAYASAQLKGQMQIDFVGGAGTDRIRSVFENDAQVLLLGALRVNLDGQDGIDTIEALLNVTAASTGYYSLVAKGGAGKDAFLVGLETNGASLTIGLDGTLVIDGGSGTDQLQTTLPQAILEVQLVENFV